MVGEMEQFGLKSVLVDEMISLAKKYGIKKMILFGSRARGDYKERSDIDLAVTGGDITKFSCDVQEDTSTLLFFDVINLDSSVQAELLESINREGIVIYEKV